MKRLRRPSTWARLCLALLMIPAMALVHIHTKYNALWASTHPTLLAFVAATLAMTLIVIAAAVGIIAFVLALMGKLD